MVLVRKYLMDTDGGSGASDAPPSSVGGTDIVRTPRLPRKDDDIASVAVTVSDQWSRNTELTLVWMKQAQFAQKVTAYAAALGQRKSAGAGKKSKTQTLRQLDKTIDAGISSIKVDIQQKFTKALAEAEYSRYGIVKVGKRFSFPKDRDQRLSAIRLAGEAATADGTGGKNYGVSFWTAMHTSYTAALNASGSNDGTISVTAKEKNDLKADILKVMRALMLIIQANYPDSFESMYREFGWQKEKY